MSCIKRLIPSLLLLLTACEDSMRDQARVKPLEDSAFFTDTRSARTLPPGTIARGQLRENAEYYTGRDAAGYLSRAPINLTKQLLLRGRERYDIYCAVCHGKDGYGKGIIVQRGFTPPPSYHIDR